MKLALALLTLTFFGAIAAPMTAHAQARTQLYSIQQIKFKLIQAKYNLARLEALIAERSSDHSIMNEIMPHDEYVGGSFFENDLAENKASLKKLLIKREQMKKTMAYYETKFGFGPEIYRNRAVATNPYNNNGGMGNNN